MTGRPRPPELEVLERIIPVGQTQTHGEWSLTCIAVEVYEDGFKVNFRAHHPTECPAITMLSLAVSDNRGGRYRPWIGGGNGIPSATGHHWRMAYNCNPHPDPSAERLQIEGGAVQSMKDDGSPRLAVDKAYPGPWIFTAAL